MTDRPGVGATVTAVFNGHSYPGEVLRETGKRALVRFATCNGAKVRERWLAYNPGPGYLAASYSVPGAVVRGVPRGDGSFAAPDGDAVLRAILLPNGRIERPGG